jgi:hypothetical protein
MYTLLLTVLLDCSAHSPSAPLQCYPFKERIRTSDQPFHYISSDPQMSFCKHPLCLAHSDQDSTPRLGAPPEGSFPSLPLLCQSSSRTSASTYGGGGTGALSCTGKGDPHRPVLVATVPILLRLQRRHPFESLHMLQDASRLSNRVSRVGLPMRLDVKPGQ